MCDNEQKQQQQQPTEQPIVVVVADDDELTAAPINTLPEEILERIFSYTSQYR
jgi:hypothetical protein